MQFGQSGAANRFGHPVIVEYTARVKQCRELARVAATKTTFAGSGQRVIGSVDALGHGTEFEIADLDPFVLFDDVRALQGPDIPTFGAHPHAGLVARRLLDD